MEGEERSALLSPAHLGQAPTTCYPGLVQPYNTTSCSSNRLDVPTRSQGIPSNGPRTSSTSMNQPRGKLACDPFSIYDDDCGEDHYFLMPKLGGGSMRNEWSRTVKNSRSLRHIQAADVKLTDAKGRTRSFPPCGQRTVSSKLHDKTLIKDSGEYCSISATGKSPTILRTPVRSLKSLHGCNNRESLRDFTSRIVVNDCNENQSSRHSLHSFDERKTRNTCCGDDRTDNDRCGQSNCTIDDIIDYCTCMFCVKGLFYHCTKDSDGETIEDPCSCTGGTRKSTCRIICMGLLSCLFPCIACYLPARGCLRLSRSCKSSKKNTDPEQYYKVRYHKEMAEFNNSEPRYL